MDARVQLPELLSEVTTGHCGPVNELLPMVYAELRALADGYLARERSDHTLQPTALVHEAYLRLLGDRNLTWQNRAHFLGIAARSMRQILVKHAKARRAAKRGGGQVTLPFDESLVPRDEPPCDVLAIEEALTSLAALDPRLSRIVELRFFGGLTIQETAEVVGMSGSAVERDWSAARAWLHQEMKRE